MWNEEDHPRGQPGNKGQFTEKRNSNLIGRSEKAESLKKTVKDFEGLSAEQIKQKILSEQEQHGRKKETSTQQVVKVNMDADIQRQFDNAKTGKEKKKIAFNYIKNNLRDKYSAPDGRTVDISLLGAKEITRQNLEPKLRVCPHLADLIAVGEFEGIVEAKKEGGQPHRHFTEFAYYKVSFTIGENMFVGWLNIGIRKDGSATLYDLNPYKRQ